MRNYTLPVGSILTTEQLGKIIQSFQTEVLPVLQKRINYYDGKQAIKFLPSKDNKAVATPDNRIVVNFCRNITDSYQGYCVGAGVSIQSDDTGIDELNEIFRYNDADDENSEFFKQGLIYGRGAEICYVDEQGKNRFRTLDPRTVIPVYDNTLDQNLMYVIRFWETQISDNEKIYTVEVYDNARKTVYESGSGFTSFTYIGEEPHYFDQVPISIFKMSEDEENIFDCIADLQDCYNTLISCSVDDNQAWTDAYLVLQGVTADADDIASMKENRVLILDNDSSASYLTKNSTESATQVLLDRTETKIREISACPNFADETFGTSSGIAIRYRCLGMENRSSNILNNFKKALQRRIELLSYMISVVNGENLFRDINIIFTRNLPVDLSENANLVTQLHGVVSDETLLSLLPFVEDVNAELDRVKKQKEENMSQYSFAMTNETDEEGEDNGEDIQI